jgi:hypothetical protein
VVDTRNYRRIWARDSVICGLAGVLIDDQIVIDGLAASLDALASELGPEGQVPSNVAVGGDGAPSYGSLAGRVDAGAWFIIGAGHLLVARPDEARRSRYRQVGSRVIELYRAWELNGRGLVNSPLGGDWADEYLLSGYVLNPNLLRLWAVELGARVLGIEVARDRIDGLAEVVKRNYWTGPQATSGERYHPGAFEAAEALPYWRSCLSPAGYDQHFDALSNSLAVLLGLSTADQRRASLDYTAELERQRGMLPAFWPPIEDGEPDYRRLEAMAIHGFRNRAGDYHNGGLWPMVNGFWAAALLVAGEARRSQAVVDALLAANRRGSDGGFYEFHSADTLEPGGTPRCTWSAAGEIIAAAYQLGRRLDIGVTT